MSVKSQFLVCSLFCGCETFPFVGFVSVSIRKDPSTPLNEQIDATFTRFFNGELPLNVEFFSSGLGPREKNAAVLCSSLPEITSETYGLRRLRFCRAFFPPVLFLAHAGHCARRQTFSTHDLPWDLNCLHFDCAFMYLAWTAVYKGNKKFPRKGQKIEYLSNR